MEANDPRHGTPAGASQHYRDGERSCEPCAHAHTVARKRLKLAGPAAKVPSVGSQRRIRALQAIGYSRFRIAREMGYGAKGSLARVMTSRTMYRSTAEKVKAVYDRLSMTIPQGPAADSARGWAARAGFPPPLAWNDIDNDAHPIGYDRAGETRSTTVDPIVVDRILSGDFSLAADTNRLEKLEVVARWTGSDKALEEKTLWNVARLRRDPRMKEAS